MQRTAHLNACVHMGIHYEDEYAEHLDELVRCANQGSPSGSNQRSPSDDDIPMPVTDDRTLSRGASTVSSHAANAEAKLMKIHREYTARLEKEHESLHRLAHVARNTLRQFLYHGPI
eukprot:1529937-Amphidinium_carterae.1